PEPAGAPSPPGTFRPLRARRPPAPSAARALAQPGDQVALPVRGLLGVSLDPRLMAGLLAVIALDLPSVVPHLDRRERGCLEHVRLDDRARGAEVRELVVVPAHG